MSWVCMIISISILFDNYNLKKSVIITLISATINFIINCISITIYSIPVFIFKSDNDYINGMMIFTLRILILVLMTRIKRIKYGFQFVKNNKENTYLDIIILNLCSIILFFLIIFPISDIENIKVIGLGLMILSIVMFSTIQKMIQLNYKQKLLVKELNQTKDELENKKREVLNLEQENLSFSKKSHSIAHKQRTIEFKLDKLLRKAEIAEELDIKHKVDNISKEVYERFEKINLDKTYIEEIDDVIEYMQAECEKERIKFNVKVNGDINKMLVDGLINKEDIEIILADHIKDAVIAINHSENIDRNILVKIGEFENCFVIQIYDSGVNFPKEVLENLGKKPITSYSNEGGEGIGYMNTFDTLRKYKASLIINEFDAKTKDNFTKVISFIFDNKNEFKII